MLRPAAARRRPQEDRHGKNYAQNFENHVHIVPTCHYVVLGLFAFNLIGSLVRVVRSSSAEAALSLLLAVNEQCKWYNPQGRVSPAMGSVANRLGLAQAAVVIAWR